MDDNNLKEPLSINEDELNENGRRMTVESFERDRGDSVQSMQSKQSVEIIDGENGEESLNTDEFFSTALLKQSEKVLENKQRQHLGFNKLDLGDINRAIGLAGYQRIETPRKPKWLLGHKKNHRLLEMKGRISNIIPFDSESQKYIISNKDDLDIFDSKKEYIINTVEKFNNNNAISLETYTLKLYIRILYMIMSIIVTFIVIYSCVLVTVITIMNPLIFFCSIILVIKLIRLLTYSYQALKKKVKSGVIKEMINIENQYSQETLKLTWDYASSGLYLEVFTKISTPSIVAEPKNFKLV